MAPIPLLLHGRHAVLPVTYQPWDRWIVPWRFTSVTDEYEALRNRVGLIDWSTHGVVELRGADRIGFLNALLTNDLRALKPGGGCRAALLDASAKLLAELVVLEDLEAAWLLCDLDQADLVARTLERYRFSEQVVVTNHERRHAVLALEGPRTLPLLGAAFGEAALASLALPQSHAVLSWEGHAIRLVRHSVIEGAGVLCLAPAEAALPLWRWLHQQGEPLGARLVGWEALNIARIEAGIPWFGLDMDATNLLPETGLEARLVSGTKGCYVGQEIVARLDTYGSVSKRLMHLVMEEGAEPERGDAIVLPGDEASTPAGAVTSACRSIAMQRGLGMGYLKRGAYEPGTRVEIVRGNARLAATVAALPQPSP